MKKKLLFVIRDMSINGATKSLINLLSLLDPNKVDVDLFLFSHRGVLLDQIPSYVNLLPEDKELSESELPVKKLISLRKWTKALQKAFCAILFRINKNWSAYLRLWRRVSILDKNYDIAIGYTEGVSSLFVIHKVRARYKWGWVHTALISADTGLRYHRGVYQKLDAAICVSTGCYDEFVKAFPECKEKATVFENILPVKQIIELANQPLDDQVYFNKQGVKILTVARLDPAKGIDRAVNVCEKLIKNGYNIYWYVVGEGKQRAEIETLINKKGLQKRFILLGNKPNPYPYIKKADIVVMPSRYEGKSIAISEAKILCRPIITTDYSTAHEQINNGVDGLIVPNNEEGLFKGIKLLLDDPNKKVQLVNKLNSQAAKNDNAVENFYRMIDKFIIGVGKEKR
ncbi:glycosyltransferase [Geobacillus proteiniphilus]|uniref:Glycosyltransferase n=1 Tax=Geobacillus proteiniphilus TaxID=860353 RepID=A0ABY9MEA6_9BACL|nr:glycosyltransferase [Geobacillus proteiniphilus]WMJ16352.1 glycosyltransferase [Geobacillus proteiniphilus]